MKLFINRAVVGGPWGGGNAFVSAFHKYGSKHGLRLVASLNELPDVILLVGCDSDSLGVDAQRAVTYRNLNPSTRLIFRLNDCDARKGTYGVNDRLLGVSLNVDSLVFVSHWLRAHLLNAWFTKYTAIEQVIFAKFDQKSTVIINGVDRALFVPRPRSTHERLRVVTHHWSDNRLKGANVYESIENIPEIDFTYIGRHRCHFTCNRTRIIEPLHGVNLASELANHDIYVTGTHADPGPNHVIEAISCGLPVLASSTGGGAVEFAGVTHTFHDHESFMHLLDRYHKNELCANALVPCDWNDCIGAYASFMKGQIL